MTGATSNRLRAAAIAAVALGALSTLGDWIWAEFIPDGAVVPGVVHGVLIFAVLALVLGRGAGSEGATGRLLATLPLTGLVLAALFYPVAYAIGYLPSLVVTWVGMWLALGLLLRWAGRSPETLGQALARGVIAAVGSGLAFWAVSGMWTNSGLAATNYPLRLALWPFAFLPGFVALLVGPRQARD